MLRILILILLLVPQMVFAADAGSAGSMQGGASGGSYIPGIPSNTSGPIGSDTQSQNLNEPGITLGMFNPPPYDMSVAYLADIFGVVDGVLHGSGSQIVGTVFGVFNSAVLMLGAIVLMYILIVSTLNTAHEGEVMGKNWSSVWIPIKAVTGFALLIPKASGYCFIQIFVMWVVVQGIGAADSVWNAALNYLARGGTIIQASNPAGLVELGNPNNPNLINPVAANIFKSQICMFGLYNALSNAALPGTVYPNFITSLTVTGVTTNASPPIYCQSPAVCSGGGCSGVGCDKCDCQAVINFPGNVGPIVNGVERGWDITGTQKSQANNYAGVCGSVTWNLGADEGGGLTGTATGQISNPSNAGASDSRSIAVNQIVLDVQPLAQTVANILAPQVDVNTGNIVALSSSGNTLTNALANRNDIASAAVDYMAIMLPYLSTQAGNANQGAQNLIAQQRGYGWILAGSYYYQLASLNKQYQANEGPTNIPNSIFKADYAQCATQPQSSKLCGAMASYLPIFAANLNTGTTGCNGNGKETNNPTTIGNAICYNMLPTSLPAASPGSTGGPFDTSGLKDALIAIGTAELALNLSLLGPLAPVMLLILGAVLDIMNHVNALGDTSTDPLLAISSLGNDLVIWAELLWFGGTLTVFITSVISSIALCLNPLGMAVTTALMWFLPMMMVIILAMFTSGAVMAYYVPLIPFILFLFTTIGWFAAVIESMIAAPLVAVGITHPEGHPILGKSDPAVMLLANVFMRPTLIILGFLFGVILSHVALWLLNQGFVNVLPTEPHDMVGFVSVIIVICIYVTIVMSVVNRSFALIHEVPNRVMRWLGQGVEQFGEEGGIREVHGAAEGLSKTATGGMEAGGVGRSQEGGAAFGAAMKGWKKSGTTQSDIQSNAPQQGSNAAQGNKQQGQKEDAQPGAGDEKK